MVEDEEPLKAPLDLPEDATHHAPKYKPKKSFKLGKLIFGLIIIALIASAAFVGWLYLSKHKTTTQTSNNTNTTTSVPKATTNKSYTNDIMRITISYPSNWTVLEDTGSFLVYSPNFSYTTVSKGTVNGNFRIYFRQGAQVSDSKYIGRGVAIQPTETLTYSKPTAAQRKSTNLSFFGLDTPDNFAYFLIAGNFTLKKGDTLGPNYGKEPDTLIIAGGYSSQDMKDGMATNTVPVDGFNQSDAYKQAIVILQSIQAN